MSAHTCPWWFAYTFDNRLRSWVHDPTELLGEFVRPGDTVVDVGCGLGHFTLGMARLVGPKGRVVAIDLQERMIRGARRRAERAGLAERIDFRTCSRDDLGRVEGADFVLAFWVVHEVDDPSGFLAQIRSFLKPRGLLFIAEPRGHVTAARFGATVDTARRTGYEVVAEPAVRFSRAVVFRAVAQGEAQ
jgi:2-polyprenyl-3-methyl-5-hydroxy-6-metoxy-1,4-benzoquinol methylase